MSAKGKRKTCFSSILDSEDDEEIDEDLEGGYISEQSITKESDDVLGALSCSTISGTNSIPHRRTSSSENGFGSNRSYLDSAYDSASSPGGSSTASGPTYIRTAGFENHAHEIISISGAAVSNSCSTMDIHDPAFSLKGRQYSIGKKGSGSILKSLKHTPKSISSSSRKSTSSNSPSSNESSNSSSPVSSASSTSSSTSREPLILRGVKKKKALLLSTSSYSEETVINNGKHENKSSGGNNRRSKLGSSAPQIAVHINHQRPKHKKGKSSCLHSLY